jgi:N-acetylated-alpha-linked acidic dipeptidase
MNRVALLAATSLLCAGAVYGADTMPADQSGVEKSFDAQVSPAEMGGWLKRLAAEPNQVGSPHDKANAEWVLAQFKSWGWDAHMETFDVLYPTPIHESLELLNGKKPFKATLQEKPIPGDSSSTAKDYALPAYFAYQGDGDVTAPVVYVNYGMPDDYDALQKMGVSVKGKIVIARYGAGWRGLKPKLAQEHGAVGCIVYSDPHDDGYATDSTYPDGPARPPQGIQRGSVQDMTLYPGDPLTPGIGATKDAKRLPISEAKTILKIPAIPISYGDAQSWRGSLPITYRVGPSTATAHLVVKSDWGMKTLYDVVAVMHGSTYPDQWVLRGNHRDGWVFGASDPLSGQIALLAEAKSMGALAATGWKPKRTIVYLGSTEWAETHADELKKKAVLYLNSDSNGRGFFSVEGSHDLEHLITGVIDEVTDPETNVSVGERYRARVRAEAVDPGGRDRDHARAAAKIAADPARDVPIEALGSGSDYSAYIEHLGLAAINIGYGGEGESGGVYHSRYDTYEHHSRFVDPGFVYDALLARTAGRLVMRAANSDLPVQRAGDFADTVALYLSEVKKLATDKKEAQVAQAGLLKDRVFALTADPTKSSGLPTAFEPVPALDFAPMDAAVDKLKASAKAYDEALAKNGSGLSGDRLAHLQALMLDIDQTLAPDVGLPGRPWFKNVIYAPGTLTGYGAKTLPAIREGIEQQRFSDAAAYIKITADALNAYSARLDQATAVLNGG